MKAEECFDFRMEITTGVMGQREVIHYVVIGTTVREVIDINAI